MELIVIDHARGDTRHLGWKRIQAALGACAFAIMVAGLAGGYLLGRVSVGDNPTVGLPNAVAEAWAGELRDSRQDIANLRQNLEDTTGAMSRKLAGLQAHVMRLNAAGERLVTVAALDAGEFSFAEEPAIGGPVDGADTGELPTLNELNSELESLESEIADRDAQMQVLADLLMATRLQAEVKPAGRPITSGWLSSRFGLRTDPFTGRKAQHKGVDFAGAEGSEVVAVASGVVTWSGRKSGYGMLVEINHGNGFVTRYGHNKEHLVDVGDRVERGQVISKMGSSGRSTGPHVHFEVLKDGRVVNPATYIAANAD